MKHMPRSRSVRTATVLTILALATAAVFAAPEAQADKKNGRITFEVTTEPADIGPGDQATLIVKGILFEKLHIYGPGDDQAMKYVPIPAKGVEYDMEKATLPATKPYQGIGEDEPRPVWETSFTLRVPIKLSKDVLAGTRIGVSFSYFGCTDRGCYPEIKDHEAFLVLKAPPAAGPVLTKPIQYEEGGAEVTLDEESETEGKLVVTFTPAFGWHFYGPADDTGSVQVEVKPKAAEGVTFGTVQPEDESAKKIDGPYKIEVPYTRKPGAKRI